jgi:hypothetical protein
MPAKPCLRKPALSESVREPRRVSIVLGVAAFEQVAGFGLRASLTIYCNAKRSGLLLSSSYGSTSSSSNIRRTGVKKKYRDPAS